MKSKDRILPFFPKTQGICGFGFDKLKSIFSHVHAINIDKSKKNDEKLDLLIFAFETKNYKKKCGKSIQNP